jgi:hypothetical protein
MRMISQRRDAAGDKVLPAEHERALGTAELDRIAAAGGPTSGGTGSGGGAGGTN